MSDNKTAKAESNKGNQTGQYKSFSLKGNKTPRPERLPNKTKRSYDVKLPTYEESQVKYEEFLMKR